jgi:hypothetical protein
MRTIVRLLAVVIVILVVAWLGLWWYAQGRLQDAMIGWTQQVSKNPGTSVTYDSITRGSSPLQAIVTMTNLKMTVQAPNQATPVVITAPTAALEIDAANPLVVHVDLPGQINLSTARGDAAITFGAANVTQHLDPQALFNPQASPLRASNAEFSDVSLLASGGSLLILHIDHFAGNGMVNPNAGAGETALSVTSTIDGIAISPLLTRLASIPFDGKIAHLAYALTASGPWPTTPATPQTAADPNRRHQVIVDAHNWAAAGGIGHIILNLTVGPSTLNASGSLKFDANEQPTGTADITANHLDAFATAVAAAYPGTADDINLIQAHLSQYLTTTDAGGQTLTMHAAFGNGTVSINGTTVAPLPPLNWATLMNPPPQAPGDGSGATQ